MKRDADVLVAGYGPVGATVTALLANAGLSVITVEQEESYYPLPRAIATDDDAIRVWQTIHGLGDRVADGLIANPEVLYESADGRAFARLEPALARTQSGYPALGLFHQPTLEAELRRTAEGFDGVTTLSGTRLIGFEQDGQGVTARLLDTRTGEERELRAGWLLGCDGAASTVRKAIGAEFGGSTFRQRWIVTDLVLDQKEEGYPQARFICDPARPAVTMPMPGGRRRWEFMLFDGEDEEEMLSDARLGQMLCNAGQKHSYSAERKVVYTFHARMADRWDDRRVFLLGDAAHVTPPFAGQGMNSGIRDAGNLWWKIAGVERNAAELRLLSSYAIERRGHVKEMIDLAIRLGAIVQTTSPPVARLRDLAFRALLGVPGVAPWFRSLGWKPAALIRKGFLDGGRRSRRSPVGQQIPALELTAADGTPESFDNRVGGRFALVSSEGDPWRAIEPGLRAIAESFGVEVLRADDGGGQELSRWLASVGARTVLVRPDRFVYGAW